jgi:hypothetical protein
MHPRTITAVLLGDHDRGRHLLATALLATGRKTVADRWWERPPALPPGPWLEA